MVREEARNRAQYSQKEIDTGGLRITTTFDKDLVDQAVKSVDETLGPRRSWPKGTQVALAAVDHRNGAVKAIYGGDGKRQTNAAAQDNAQAGSTFKPFTLIAYLEGKDRRKPGDCSPKGFGDDSGSLRARFDGRNNLEVGGVKVRNFSSRSFGRMDVADATANSVNSVYVAMNEEAGPEHTRAVAECAGLPTDTPGLDDDNLFNVLGTSSPHPLDMAGAYATIAARGERHPRHVIDAISVRGKQGYRFEDKGEQVFDPEVVADATYAMQQVVRRGSGEYARRLGFPTAGKTGTSNANRSAWFVGFDARRLATAVTLYRVGEDGAEEELEGFKGAREITGGSLPVRVWTDFMGAALDGQERQDFPRPVYGGGNAGAEPEYTPPPTQEPEPEPTRPTARPTPTREPEQSPSPTTSQTPSPTQPSDDDEETDPRPTDPDAEPTLPVEPTPGTTQGRIPRPSLPNRSP
jgi:membrane peptidoglycan carboxypeptidase